VTKGAATQDSPANRLSLGALDFGMVVEGAIVMVENVACRLGHQGGIGARQDESIERVQ
jgi:Cu/Ag efflux pump CusA